MYVHVYIMCMYVYICIYIHIYTYMHIYIYIYIHIHTHIRVYIYIYMLFTLFLLLTLILISLYRLPRLRLVQALPHPGGGRGLQHEAVPGRVLPGRHGRPGLHLFEDGRPGGERHAARLHGVRPELQPDLLRPALHRGPDPGSRWSALVPHQGGGAGLQHFRVAPLHRPARRPLHGHRLRRGAQRLLLDHDRPRRPPERHDHSHHKAGPARQRPRELPEGVRHDLGGRADVRQPHGLPPQDLVGGQGEVLPLLLRGGGRRQLRERRHALSPDPLQADALESLHSGESIHVYVCMLLLLLHMITISISINSGSSIMTSLINHLYYSGPPRHENADHGADQCPAPAGEARLHLDHARRGLCMDIHVHVCT